MSFRTMSISAIVVLAAGTAASAQFIGPSTTAKPHLLPWNAYAGQVTTTSILTVGDSVGGYRLAGLPDGMGAFMNDGGNSFSLLVNHEIGGSLGAVRAHGQTGAFVSRWNIGTDLSVISGRDHNTSAADAYEYTPGSGWSNTPSPAQRWSRFCSADLAAPSAYKFGDLGTDARIFMNGEEAGAEGRAYAHIVTGAGTNQTWQLPHLGRFSWENSIANPFAQEKTVVIGTDDSSPGQVYMYVGNKTNTGNDIERAGLTNGNLYGIRVPGVGLESRTTGIGSATRFETFSFGDVSATTGAALQTQSQAGSVTEFLRPEDGAWDPRPGQENNFYFVTTDRFDSSSQVGRSRLWRMTYDDITNPTAGGTITALLSGAEGQQMFDNLTIDSHGRILIQEDPGAQDYLARIWMYDIGTANFGPIAEYTSEFFAPGAAGFLTRDEESSGIIDAKDILGDGWFLINSQAHYSIPGELVEGGQLLAMYVNPSLVPAPGAVALVGMAGLVGLRRRR